MCSCAAPGAVYVIFLMNGSIVDNSNVEEGISFTPATSQESVTLNVETRVPNTKTTVVCRAVFIDNDNTTIPSDQQCNDIDFCADSDPAMLITKFGVRDITLCSNETGQLCITCQFGELEGTNISGCVGDIVATSEATRNFTFEIPYDRGNVNSASKCIEVDVPKEYCVLVYDLHTDGSRSVQPAAKQNITLNAGENPKLLGLISVIAIIPLAIIIVVCVYCCCKKKRRKTQAN